MDEAKIVLKKLTKAQRQHMRYFNSKHMIAGGRRPNMTGASRLSDMGLIKVSSWYRSFDRDNCELTPLGKAVSILVDAEYAQRFVSASERDAQDVSRDSK